MAAKSKGAKLTKNVTPFERRKAMIASIEHRLQTHTLTDTQRENLEIRRLDLTRLIEKDISDQQQAQYNKKQQMINAEKARFGRNYFARDYISGMTDWTASAVIRKPFNRSGLRSEFRSRGYTDPSSGMPAADYKNTTGSLVKGRVKGTLDVGGVSGRLLGGKMTDALIPRKYAPGYNLGSGNTGIGSGNVIMPVGLLKIKKRGGKFNIYS